MEKSVTIHNNEPNSFILKKPLQDVARRGFCLYLCTAKNPNVDIYINYDRYLKINEL